MTKQLKILVTGATGNVGGQVVTQLREAGQFVRAFTRNSAVRLGDETVHGGFDDLDSLAAAAEGADAAFLMWPLHTSDTAVKLVDVLAQRVRRIVFLSSGAAQDPSYEPIGRIHAEVEQAVAGAAEEWTILRPSAFAANARWWAPQLRVGDEVRGAYGGVEAPLLHERDMAAVAVCALTGDGHHGTTYDLTGPAVLSQAEQVAAIGAALGRPVRWV